MSAPLIYCGRCGAQAGGGNFCSGCGGRVGTGEGARRRKQRSRLGIARPFAILTAAVAAVALVAAPTIAEHLPSGGPLDPGTRNVRVKLTVPPGHNDGLGSSCDIRNFGTLYMFVPGAKLSVIDETGGLTGSTVVPHAGRVESRPNPDWLFNENCAFTFTVDVGSEARFYTFRVGEVEGPTFSRADMIAANWSLEFGW